ncbi:MAG: CBS domain containing membrane protein [Parcubacteria group bacterium Gr01-1014_70]|nr:MAG: CBS domain containing membrane protein [Parcubacteria group bacterium Gr01-1014_70]
MTVSDIMTHKVVSVRDDMQLLDAYRILARHRFDGVPVVDSKARLVGILTEYDVISKESLVHLSTLQVISAEVHIYKKDASEWEKEVTKMLALRVRDVMNPDPLTLPVTASFTEAVSAFQLHHRVNPIPIIDAKRHVVGVISRFDVLKPLSMIKKRKHTKKK